MNPVSITSYIEDLRRSGVDEPTAMAHARALGRVINDEFATKADLREHTNHLEGEINLLGRELRAEMKAQEDRLKALEERMNAKMDALGQGLTIRLGAMLIAGISALAVLDKLLN